MTDLVTIGVIAAVAGAAAGYIPLLLARRSDRDTLTKTAQIVEKLPGLAQKINDASERLTRLEVKLGERERRESRDEKAAIDAAELNHRRYCEKTCPVRKDWEIENTSQVRPNPLFPPPTPQESGG